MRFPSLLAVLALSAAVTATSSTPDSLTWSAEPRDDVEPHNSGIYGSGRHQIQGRGVNGNINVKVAVIRLKLHKAQAFCSQYLHISPYAATATKFVTATKTVKVPGLTSTNTARITVTSTAKAATVTSTTLSVVDSVLTTTTTKIAVVPTTVTVDTVTSLSTVEVPTIVGTVTVFTSAAATVIPRDERKKPCTVKIPQYLEGARPATISCACSKIVTLKTTTVTATRTATRAITKPASTITATVTKVSVVTPTSTVRVPSISTRIIDTVVVPVTETSLSTVGVTATTVVPTTVLIPSSTTIYLPSPTVTSPAIRGYIQLRKVSDGSVLGLVRVVLDSQKSYTYTPDTSGANALIVSIAAGWKFGSIIDFPTENADSQYQQIGAVGGSGGYNFLSNMGYAYLAPVAHADIGTQTNAHAINAVGYNAPAESQIWTINEDFSITATWTEPQTANNPQQGVPATIFYDTAVDFVGIVNNLDTFIPVFPGEGAFAVTAHIVPI
ncbi:unnamed protein product [Tilletia controversa]|nr:unnamed protein product [Tilletia controversa]CAD6973509.1 unnamed protein product [Tilletia controversa]